MGLFSFLDILLFLYIFLLSWLKSIIIIIKKSSPRDIVQWYKGRKWDSLSWTDNRSVRVRFLPLTRYEIGLFVGTSMTALVPWPVETLPSPQCSKDGMVGTLKVDVQFYLFFNKEKWDEKVKYLYGCIWSEI